MVVSSVDAMDGQDASRKNDRKVQAGKALRHQMIRHQQVGA